ncbi:MAG: seg [Candidatus Kaiserbacteria bacterium]|nr:seg [Candidatus Kaiserbacteria bacterium]
METSSFIKPLRLIVLALIVTILGGMTGWYVYLKTKETSIQKIDQLRGNSTTNTQYNSFGTPSTGGSAANQGTSTPIGIAPSAKTIPRIWHVDAQPIAGYGFSSSTLEYIPRANGNIFAADLASQTTVRVTDTLFPEIYEAYVAQDGSVVERSLDTNGNITTFLGTIHTVAPTASNATTSAHLSLSGAYTAPNALQFALNAKTKTYIYTAANPTGGASLYSQGWNDAKPVLITSLPLKSWVPSILTDGRIFLTQSPADNIPGYSYQVTSTGVLNPYMRAISGLMILPRTSGKEFLYSSSASGLVNLVFATSSTGLLVPLSTIADKCVWMSSIEPVAYCAVPKSITDKTYITDWYQGLVHTSDEWWRVDSATTTRIYDPVGDGIAFDVENPQMDPTGNFIVFRNRTDQSLWALRVTQ